MSFMYSPVLFIEFLLVSYVTLFKLYPFGLEMKEKRISDKHIRRYMTIMTTQGILIIKLSCTGRGRNTSRFLKIHIKGIVYAFKVLFHNLKEQCLPFSNFYLTI
jgi:hypothetical protein